MEWSRTLIMFNQWAQQDLGEAAKSSWQHEPNHSEVTPGPEAAQGVCMISRRGNATDAQTPVLSVLVSDSGLPVHD